MHQWSPESTQRVLSLADAPLRPSPLARLPSLAGLFALCLLVLPGTSRADIPPLDKFLELHMYGRMGVAWTPVSGDIIQGKSLNLTGNSVGGRLEEGDYLEPTIKFHILRGDTDKDPYARLVLTPAMFAKSGSYISLFTANNLVLDIELFQGYLEAGNILLPDLKVWIGQRFYRGGDVHIADNFYFNNLSSQGAGVIYGPLDLAVLLQTGSNSQYAYSSTGLGSADSARQRTVFVAQYVVPLGGKHTLQGLGELHVLPEARKPGQDQILPRDTGWVIGAKLHLDLDGGSWNDISVRYGGGIANGALGGSPTLYTYGLADSSGRYNSGGALGLEAVEHFVWNANSFFSVNGYAMFHYAKGASGTSADSGLDVTAGFRFFQYITNNFHLIEEAHVQGRKIGDADLGTMVKLSLVPTIVPTGDRSVWARPHLRFFYTIAFYNDAAVKQSMTPYMSAEGASSVAHYIGTRAEWWF